MAIGMERRVRAFSFSEMARVLADMVQTGWEAKTFRAPTYSGEGDVELFLAQFDDV